MGGWTGSPSGTLFHDSLSVHSGRFAVRMERTSPSTTEFSHIGRTLPITFAGDTLELRGWLRTEGVLEYAGLWLREDGAGGSVEFDNMQDRNIKGTTPWTEYRIALPLNRKAKTVVFGALLVGPGAIQVDDLRLLVDGQDPSRAPPFVHVPTAAETDHEFDGDSRVVVTRLSPQQVENLVLLGKVWGFVKYHHPRVAAAQLNWDYELFRALPSVLAAADRSQAASAIATWLDRIGAPEPPKEPATPPDSAQTLAPIKWIGDRTHLGEDLCARLERIHARRGPDEDQYYVGLFPGVGNPDFSNESPYANPAFPDAGYRLLALFRFWNIIEYWSPYRALIREDWDGVLREFVPRLVAAQTQDEYRLAMMALVARVHDSHTNLWSSLDVRPPRGDCQLPLTLRFVQGKFVVGAYADSLLGSKSGLKIGDVIQSLDGLRVDSLATAWAPYYGASNEAARMRDIARTLTRGRLRAVPCARLARR